MPVPDVPGEVSIGLTLPRAAAAMRALARVASVFPIVIGWVVLAGWWLDIESLMRVVPGLVAMNPTTAVAFIALGFSLAFALRGSERTSRVLAIIPAMVGLIKISDLLLPLDIGIDQLLFRSQLETADRGLPNRMAPNTALNFVLLGTAVAFIDRNVRRIWPSQILTAIAAMSSLLALTGYAYGVRAFYGIGAYIPMALHTALTFFVVSIGILCARPGRGIMAVASSNTTGGAMMRRLLPAILLLPALLGFFRLAGTRARLFDADLGLWILVVLTMTILTVLVGWNGRLLFRSDIDRLMSERTLTHQASHDSLTQLPNRRLFIEELDRELKSGRRCAVLFVDLDLFKVINDSLGHVIGDELLIAAGRRIHDSVGERDLVARLGGDEFTILVRDADTMHRPLEIAERLLHAFSSSFSLGPHEVFTTASVGIASSEGGDSPVTLIRHADMAMHHAKKKGKNRSEVFDSHMDLAAIRRLELETELRRAIERDELCLYYQPEVEIDTGALVGMEALVRWKHPERGLISPSEFLPVAEETGLILAIGRWGLYEASRQAKEWQEKYRPDLALMVSVNLSGKHFQQATLIDEVAEVLNKTGIDPGHLIIEITESVAMEGAEGTIEILTRLKSLGVKLAIDDFGTGFSSLSYLKRFPVDMLKIDKSFVDGVAGKGPDRAIVEAVIALGHALGLKVIAEGVETKEQVARLRELGSELAQGFYFGEPLSDDTNEGMPNRLSTGR